MKLLLVDDEAFTREGILSVIPWEELDIDEVITAADGEEGIAAALAQRPDIILTDVRMPRLDGVSMSHRIREELPCCCIIFMSGYADKEYLKSAIRLCAINYIEKPFQPQELQATLRIAVEKCRELAAAKNTSLEMTQRLNLSLPAVRNQIALALTHPSSGVPADESLQAAWPGFNRDGAWITFLIRLLGDTKDSYELTPGLKSAICDLLGSRLALADIAHVIIGEKGEQTIVVHMNLRTRQWKPIPSSQIATICYMLCDILKSTCRFLLATGHPADCFDRIYDSYQTASITLQRGFFHKENAVLFYEEKHNHLLYQFGEDSIKPFDKALRRHDKDAVRNFITSLVEKLRRFDGTLASSVKNLFVQMLCCLRDFAILCKIPSFSESETPEELREIIWRMDFLTQIEAYLLKRAEEFFEAGDSGYSKYPLAYQIRRYLDESYENEDLSLQDIALYFSVSESYACIIFKKAFDNTINHYLIELRVERAIHYLTTTNKKIKEISELVGYRDCNYFIRIFKKVTGTTPADYKRKI